MPRQVNGVEITDLGGGRCNVQIGPSGYEMEIADLFLRDFREDQIRHNMRLAHRIGNYGELASVEFQRAVNNGTNGLQGRDRKYFITVPKLLDPTEGLYEVGLSETNSGTAAYAFQVYQYQMLADPQDEAVILLNLPAFTRIGGWTALGPAMINAVRNRAFWV